MTQNNDDTLAAEELSTAAAAESVQLSYKPAAVGESAPSRSFLGHAKFIGLLTLASRIFGLLREVVAGHYLGTGLVASSFTVAFVVPNLFRKLFGEGALSAAFIPLYAQARQRDGDEAANAFAASGVNMLVTILLLITLAGEIVICSLIYFGDPHKVDRQLVLKLTAIMLPYVILICGTAFLGGVLQVRKRFGAPAAAPVILNVVHIIVVFVGAHVLQLHATTTGAAAVEKQTTLAYWLAFFVLVAGVLQVMVLLPALHSVGFKFRATLHFWNPAIRNMVRLSAPVAMGAGVLQLSVLLDKGISQILMKGPDENGHMLTHFHLLGHAIRYPMELGAPARLNLAQFLYQFPLGIFAIALATAIFPSLSAEALGADKNRFRAVMRQGIEATMLEGLPASLGLMIVAGPAVRLLFRHGQVSDADAALITKSVIFYSSAIWAFSLQQIINRAYYALHDTVTPLVLSILTLAVNLAVELPLLWTPLGEAGMAAGTCASFALQSILMLWLLDRRVGGLELSKSVKPIAKMFVATVLMGIALWAVMHTPIYPRGQTRVAWSIQLLILMIVGAGVYAGACTAMGVPMLRQLLPKRRKPNIA